MKTRRFICILFALCLSLTACGGQQAASRTADVPGNTVAQVLQEASDAADVSMDTMPPIVDDETVYPVNPPSAEERTAFSHDGIDIDLTRMSSTMVYGQVSGMMYTPDEYVGKTIRMAGKSYSMYYEETDTTYYSILIADATACCAQGVEYVLLDGNYPADETETVVTGVFELYEELGMTYCRLSDASITA